jgi:hypothetical protein
MEKFDSVVVHFDADTSANYGDGPYNRASLDLMIDVQRRAGEPLFGIDAVDQDGRPHYWRPKEGWKQAAAASATSVSYDDIMAGRRVFCAQGDDGGMLGFGVVEGSLDQEGPERAVCQFPALSGLEVRSAIPVERLTLLPDTIELRVLNAGGDEIEMVDITDTVMGMPDERILEILDGPVEALPVELKELLSQEAQAPGARADVVESICDYLGSRPMRDLASGELSVPEATFRDVLENTVQCRIQHEARKELLAKQDVSGPNTPR